MDPSNTKITSTNHETKSFRQPTKYNADAFALVMIARCYKLYKNTQLNKTIVSIISDYKDLFITTINDRIKEANTYNIHMCYRILFKNFNNSNKLPEILHFIKYRSEIFTIDRAQLQRIIGNESEFSAATNDHKDFEAIEAVKILIRSNQEFHKHISPIYLAIFNEGKKYGTCIDILSSLANYITNHENPKLFKDFCDRMLKPNILKLCEIHNQKPKDFILANSYDSQITAQMKLDQINDAMQKQSKQHTDTLDSEEAINLVTSFHRSPFNIHTSNATSLT